MPRRFLLLVIVLFAATCAACTENDNAHTTATTIVPAPPRQILSVSQRPSEKVVATPAPELQVDAKKAFAVWQVSASKRVGQSDEVVIDFALANATLKGDGGEYRVRYIVDDGEMRWIDRWEQTVLTGWTPGEHSIRLELIGPDLWPFHNGNANIVTKKITVEPNKK